MNSDNRNPGDSQSQKILTLEINDLTFDGHGVARNGRDVYFVPGALPGETVTARLAERRKKIWYCDLVSIEQSSEQRQQPQCPHYNKCGGCDLQHLKYENQVQFKQARVKRELSRYGLDVDNWAEPVIGNEWAYRRRARLGVRYSKEKERIYLGFREANNNHLTDIDQCPVLVDHPALNWSEWRQRILELECRARVTQIEVLQTAQRLVLVFRILKSLSPSDSALFSDWAQSLDVEIYQRPDEGELIPLSPIHTLFHEVQGHALTIHPDYFIQVNQSVNEQMVAQALDWLAPVPDALVWDLFAGHGNFSVPLAVQNKVHAIEVSDQMVAALEQHSQTIKGQVEDAELIAHKADLSDSRSLERLPGADFILLDPPRAGAAECLQGILAQQPKRIVYVSCDPATLVRDLIELTEQNYRITKIGILDMFPNTHHVETMVLLEPGSQKKIIQDKSRLSKRGGLKKPAAQRKSLHRRTRGMSRG